jgi:hypothetical protein
MTTVRSSRHVRSISTKQRETTTKKARTTTKTSEMLTAIEKVPFNEGMPSIFNSK